MQTPPIPAFLAGRALHCKAEDGIDDTPERQIRRALFKSLAVPQPVVEAIEVLWEGYLAFPPVSLGDTLLLAYELAPVKSPLRESRMVNDGAIQDSINMVVGGETLTEILQDSAREVESLVRAL